MTVYKCVLVSVCEYVQVCVLCACVCFCLFVNACECVSTCEDVYVCECVSVYVDMCIYRPDDNLGCCSLSIVYGFCYCFLIFLIQNLPLAWNYTNRLD